MVMVAERRDLRALSVPTGPASGLGADGQEVLGTMTRASFADLLTVDLQCDGHFACYELEHDGVVLQDAPRLRKEALGPLRALGTEVWMRAVVVDVDLKHVLGPASERWDALTPEQARAMRDLSLHHPPGLPPTCSYATRGGWRHVHELALPVPAGPGFEALLTRTIEAYHAAGVPADRQCRDWTRLFRCPRVIRDGQWTGTAPWYWERSRFDDDTSYLVPQPEDLVPQAEPDRHLTPTSREGQPDDDAADALLRQPDQSPTPLGRVVEQALRSSPAHSHVFQRTPLALGRGNRHDALLRHVGLLVKLLRHVPGADPALAYACALQSARLLDDDEDWRAKAWEMTTSFWSRQQPACTQPSSSGSSSPPTSPASSSPALPSGSASSTEPGEMACDDDGRPYPTPHNVRVALALMGVVLWLDQHADRVHVEGLPSFGPYLDDAALDRLWFRCEEEHRLRVGYERFCKVLFDLARLHARHPVRDYLDSLAWDGVPRVATWTERYLGVPPTAYSSAVGSLFLVAAVRRVRSPGCKFDEMVVLESDQGAFKSTALAVLAVRDEWFSDSLPVGADGKVVLEQTTGKWIMEAADMQGMTRRTVDELKAFLSRRADRARMAYGRTTTERARQFVVVGSTNSESYLRDATGNRRFWPLRVAATRPLDVQALRADRDQLWAEACVLEAQGHPTRLDPSLYAAAEAQQEERRVQDPFEADLAEHLPEEGVLAVRDAWELVGLDPGRRDQDGAVRLGAAMRRLGWRRTTAKIGGKARASFQKGTTGHVPKLRLVKAGPRSMRLVPVEDLVREPPEPRPPRTVADVLREAGL